MQEKSIKVLLVTLLLIGMFSIFVIAENESDQNKTNSSTSDQNITNHSSSGKYDINTVPNKIKMPSAEECFNIEDRKFRIKCEIQNRAEIKSKIAEKYSEFLNSTSIYETCNGTKNQGLCVAFMARSLKCYKLDGEEKDRCFKEVSNFKEAKMSGEIQSDGNITKTREKIVSYMVLVLQDLGNKVEKASEDGKINDDDASVILEKITRIKRFLMDGNTKKVLINSEITELKALWQRTMKNG